MLELVLTVEYETGTDRLTDAFVESPQLRAETVACVVTAESMWRVDRLTGPADAIEDVEAIFLDEDHCNECLGPGGCGVDREYEVLRAGATSRTIYARRSALGDCHSIPYLALERFGDGLLFDAERRGRRYEWRVLLGEDAAVEGFATAIEAKLRAGLEVDRGYVGEPIHW